jgi:DNA-binding CsgD family transcriptional regulator
MSIDSSQISEREREILRLVAMGATNQQIAHQLNISINTVKVHLRNIFGKINVASRTEATVYAIQQGLVSIDRQQASVEAPAQFPAVPPDLASGLGPSIMPVPESAPIAVVPSPEPRSEPAELDSIAEPPAPAVLVLEPRSVGATADLAVSAAPSVPRLRRLLLPITIVAALAVIAGLIAYSLIPRQSVSQIPDGVAQPNNWRNRTTLPAPRNDFGAVAYDGKLYVIGGSDAQGSNTTIERYDPSTNVWVSLGDKPTATSHIQAAVVRGLIYVPGGEASDGTVLNIFESYDPRSQRWEQLPQLPEPRSRYALASVEGRLYLFGGWDGSSTSAEVFIYDPDAKRWSTGAALPTPRRSAGAAVIEGRIYVIGGESDAGAQRVNERYDPNSGEQGQWQSIAPLPAAMAVPSITNIGSNILVFDSQQHAGFQYNSTSDAWEAIVIPDTIPVVSQVALFNNTSVFLFGAAADGAAATVSEYHINQLFLPSIGTGQ